MGMSGRHCGERGHGNTIEYLCSDLSKPLSSTFCLCRHIGNVYICFNLAPFISSLHLSLVPSSCHSRGRSFCTVARSSSRRGGTSEQRWCNCHRNIRQLRESQAGLSIPNRRVWGTPGMAL